MKKKEEKQKKREGNSKWGRNNIEKGKKSSEKGIKTRKKFRGATKKSAKMGKLFKISRRGVGKFFKFSGKYTPLINSDPQTEYKWYKCSIFTR